MNISYEKLRYLFLDYNEKGNWKEKQCIYIFVNLTISVFTFKICVWGFKG